MRHPIFFSLAGTHDRTLAESVKSRLSDHLVYLYTRTGAEGENIYREIEAEIAGCQIFVVFWSDDYLESEYATWELALFKKLNEASDSPKQMVIVPTKVNGREITSKWRNPLSQKEEFVFGKWRLERAIDEGVTADVIADHISRRLNDSGHAPDLLVSRPNVQRLIKTALSGRDFMSKEVVFVSGHEGNGRRTSVRQYMESTFRHLSRKTITFDSLDGPEDLLPRLMQADGRPHKEVEKVLQEIEEGKTTPAKEVRRLLHGFRSGKSYLICAMDRFTAVDLNVWLPSWVPKLLSVFEEGPAPILFFITSSALREQDFSNAPHAGLMRMPGLDEQEMRELIYGLANIDPNSGRWTKEKKELVVAIAGNSPALAQMIMRKAAFQDSLDYLEDMARKEADRFSEGLTALLSYSMQHYKESRIDILALLIIERLGLASKQAVDSILGDQQSWDLFGMLQLGLLERLSDDLLRIPPLLQRRLGYILLNTEFASEAEALIGAFGNREDSFDDGYGPVFFANKAAASLRFGSGQSGPNLRNYVTLAMLARAGIERYTLEDWEGSHSVLSRAFDRLTGKRDLDIGVKIEIARYFGLSAARVRLQADVHRACDYLSLEIGDGRRAVQGEAMSHFLRGFYLRLEGNFEEALSCFTSADELLRGVKNAERQHGAVLTELSRTLIKLRKPRYDAAVDAAQRAFEAKDVAHNLNALIRAKLARLANWNQKNQGARSAEETKIEENIATLQQISRRIGREFDLVRRAELELIRALRAAAGNPKALDLTATMQHLTRALQIRSQPSTQSFIWKAQLLHGLTDFSVQVMKETSAVKRAAQETSRRRGDAELMYVWAAIKKAPKSAQQQLQLVPWANQSFRNFMVDFADKKLRLDPRLLNTLERF